MFVADSGVDWNNSYYDQEIIIFTSKWKGKFQEYGIAIHSNEENKDCDGCNWKEEF